MPVAGLPGCCPVVPLLISKAPVEENVESVVAVKPPVIARVDPFQAKLALSLSKPDAPAKVTRPDVKALFLIDPAVRNVPSQVKLADPPKAPLLLN